MPHSLRTLAEANPSVNASTSASNVLSNAPRKSSRVRKTKSFGDDFHLYLVEEAMASRDVAFWKEAIQDEMDSIMQNNIWKLTDLPLDANHWFFNSSDGCKNNFLNGELDEEVYMKQPEGFVLPGNKHKVCKVIKSLYGLKQAPKQWHQKFDEVILSNGFLLYQADKCVYNKLDSSGKGVIICLYVDDMLIFGTDQAQIDETKNLLKFLMNKLLSKLLKSEAERNAVMA
ncbi:hypothetical protein E3N88_41527 [Mikania micrantha]|uniref:Reverse transcriptase Ty1/copia-type domain-containing protein n=1 Tax=Mikania micrantha TaxID=192012 RepID=A0A5N6LKG3_9ASTR|nr:hypothetical protein E3N88_41527 [Mikania micrantha]